MSAVQPSSGRWKRGLKIDGLAAGLDGGSTEPREFYTAGRTTSGTSTSIRCQYSIGTTLGERNQRKPPCQGAVVNRCRSSSAKTTCRKNSASFRLYRLVITVVP